MNNYFDEEFYKCVQEELRRYNSDYKMKRDLIEQLEESERKRILDEEESIYILEKFGAVI